MNKPRRPNLLRGYAKQLAAEIIGDEPLQKDGRREVRKARVKADRETGERGAGPERKPEGDEADGSL